MKIDLWFDFNKENQMLLNAFINALDSYVHKDKLTIGYRSIPVDNNTLAFHETYQFMKRKGVGVLGLKSLLDAYINGFNINQACIELSKSFNIELKELLKNLETKKSLNVVNNHLEHAQLQHINQSPTITMSHGFRLIGHKTKDEIKETLIQMYEKDTGIEYCEENCER